MTHTSGIGPSGYWAAYGAAAWSLIFGVLHGLWAFGWYVALPSPEAQMAFEATWFLVYDVVVVAICGLGIVVALALARPGAWGRTGRVLRLLGWVGTAVLLLRAGSGVLQFLYLAGIGRYAPEPMHLYELWFCLGALLFLLSALRARRVL